MDEIKRLILNENRADKTQDNDKSEIFIVQGKMINKVNALIDKVSSSGEPFPHVLLVGDDGLEKEKLVKKIAKNMGRKLSIINAPDIDREGNFIGILTNMEEGDILAITDIDKMNKKVKDFLYPAFSCKIDFVVDKGPHARTIKFNLKCFSIFATTSQPNKLNKDLLKHFFSIYHFVAYSPDEITQIILYRAQVAKIKIDQEPLRLIANKSGGIPGEAIGIFNRVVKFAGLCKSSVITKEITTECLHLTESEFLAAEKTVDRNIPDEIRLKVWRRDFGKCVKCG